MGFAVVGGGARFGRRGRRTVRAGGASGRVVPRAAAAAAAAAALGEDEVRVRDAGGALEVPEVVPARGDVPGVRRGREQGRMTEPVTSPCTGAPDATRAPRAAPPACATTVRRE